MRFTMGGMAATASLALALAAPAGLALAETAAEKGLAIAEEMDKRDTGFEDSSAQLLMVLRNRHGQESKRELRSRTLEGQEDGDKTLIIFDHPGDIEGTALLSFTHKTGDDDQWLYLPALKRVKRIASSNKSGPFVGSEFAYEDISSQEVEKYTYTFVREEKLDDVDMFVIERDPVDPRSGYTKQVVWLDQAEYRPFKIEFFDRKGELLKTLTYEGYQKYIDTYWRADAMHMVNHQTGKSTVLNWKSYAFKNGFGERDFDQKSLKRAR